MSVLFLKIIKNSQTCEHSQVMRQLWLRVSTIYGPCSVKLLEAARWTLTAWVHILSPALRDKVTLGKFLYLSLLDIPHLWSGNGVLLVELLEGMNELTWKLLQAPHGVKTLNKYCSCYCCYVVTLWYSMKDQHITWDLVIGDQKLILGLFWNLYIHF